MVNWLWESVKSYFFRYFPFVVVFAGSLFNPSDADLGWHLKYGEYFFLHHGVLRENIYSTMMAGYQWVNSSWATDIITYATFHNFGFFGLTVLSAITVTLTFYLFSKAAKLDFWEQAFIIPLLLNFEEPLIQISFRGHLLTLLFFGILYFLISKFNEGKRRMLFWAIPLFIIWSNIHGEFILGLVVLAAWVFFRIISEILLRKDNLIKIITFHLHPLSVFIISFTAATINPFSFGVYSETIRHFGNPLQKYVVEWLPFDTFSQPWWKLVVWGILILISVMLLIRKKEFRNNLQYIGPAVILFGLSFWMRRYTWPMLFISVPVIRVFFSSIKPKITHIAVLGPVVSFILIYLFYISVRNPSLGISGMNWDRYCQWYMECSPKSAQFLTKNKPQGKMLTFYNWGGWLIWNYPRVKPSIDGRMHLWRDEKGYSAFAEYYAYEQNWADVNDSDYSLVYITPNKPLYKQMVKHVDEGTWKVIYKDENASVFERISSDKGRTGVITGPFLNTPGSYQY